MRVARVQLENFKRFPKLDIRVENELTKEIANTFLVLGDNGTGKTTVLQAIALCLSKATGQTRSVEDFDWLGWVPGRYERWGRPVITLDVTLSQEEVDATRETARRWFESLDGQPDGRAFVEPGDATSLTLRLEGDRLHCPKETLFQFRGRAYAASLLRRDPSARDLFDQLPGVFWFDQLRNLGYSPREQGEEVTGRVDFNIGVGTLRDHLNNWLLGSKGRGAGQRDFLAELERLYQRVFSGRSFGAPEPMYSRGVPTPSDFYFILNDGNRTYDIAEMSSGEQSVFPLLYAAVRQQFRHSVVLIDEVDLNLHPPLAQTLVQTLPMIGPGCQFFLTTHSEAVTSVVSPEQTYRLPGGRLCL